MYRGLKSQRVLSARISQQSRKTNNNYASKHATYSGTPVKGHRSLEKCLIPGLEPGVSKVSLQHLAVTDGKGCSRHTYAQRCVRSKGKPKASENHLNSKTVKAALDCHPKSRIPMRTC